MFLLSTSNGIKRLGWDAPDLILVYGMLSRFIAFRMPHVRAVVALR